MLSKAAGPQRSGILASLSMALNAFRLLPTKECDRRQWSASEWCATRTWLDLHHLPRDYPRHPTPAHEYVARYPLLRLMAKTSNGQPPKPVWLIIDELASLNKLPSLQSALTRARKYQIKTVFGYQQQSQLQELYGKEGAETITGNPSTKIFFRTGDATPPKAVSAVLVNRRSLARRSTTLSPVVFTPEQRTYSIEVKTGTRRKRISD